VFGTEIEASLSVEDRHDFQGARRQKFVQLGAVVKHRNRGHICCQKKAIQYIRTAEIVARFRGKNQVHFSEGLWHRFRGGLLVLFTSYCCTFYVDNVATVKLRIFLRAQ
jgi:hypothetical protein